MFTKRLALGLTTLVLGGVALAISPLASQEEMMDMSTPHHKMIMKGVGNWEGTITQYMPGVEPVPMPCTETVTGIGNLWTTGHFEMDFMGTPFEGISTLGYDTIDKKFVGTWADSMSPKMAHMEGTYDEKKGAIIMHYDMFEVMTGETKKMRSETAHKGDSYTIDFYDVSGEKEALMMKIEMKRKMVREAGSTK